MKKPIISAAILLLLIATLGFYIFNAKSQRENFFVIDKKIHEISLLNKDFDLYLKNNFSYENFDIVEKKVLLFEAKFKEIKYNKILEGLDNQELQKLLTNLDTAILSKLELISRIKSYKAILNNSFRILQKIHNKDIISSFNKLYTLLLTMDKNPEIDIQKELANVNKLLKKYQTNSKDTTITYEKYFLKHARTILKYQVNFNILKNSLIELDVNQKLNKFSDLYAKSSNESMQKVYFSVIVLFLILLVAIAFYLIYEYKLRLSNKELSRFRRTVESSDNIVLITDKNEIITYVNDAFMKTTGYAQDEIIGKKPNILKSGRQSKEFYQELQDTIHKGKTWSGEFINIDKFGELSYEKASITPVFDDNGKIKEFISIKLDITNETVIGQQLKRKEELLIQQSKMAAMGEMIENIAHQWRQPLSAISTSVTSMQMQKELGISTHEDEIAMMEKINSTAQYLSSTINDFRDFFNPNKEKTIFNLKDVYIKTLNIVSSKFKALNIEMVENINDVNIRSFDSETIQVILNLLNNAKDILETKENQKRLIFVDIYKENNDAIILIKDNAGGIPRDIIKKVFEPYFTTKHQSQGTGIGLYMSQEIVTKHMQGLIEVSNTNYQYENKSYTGALFKISIPLEKDV